ncbi:MAG: virulence RhuM family protein [bacterium]
MKKSKLNSEVIIYQSAEGTPSIEVRLENAAVWLTIDQMTILFEKSRSTINEHILNIFSEKELAVIDSMRKIGISDLSTKPTNYYNLDVIISVGYRVKSTRGTLFRQWATARLREYMVKGFAMDDQRLKKLGGGGYWKELLARIRDIRSSEKVFYRQILDIYATSMDYNPKDDTSLTFFKKIQNKMHYAVHGHTAAEVIYHRADAEKEFMGLATFSGTHPHLADVVIAKNYLNEKELRALGQIVSGYLDFAERQADREMPMKMVDWASHLDAILTSTGESLLQDAGTVSHEKAVEKATEEYVKYQAKTMSDVEMAYLDSLKTIQEKVQKPKLKRKK